MNSKKSDSLLFKFGIIFAVFTVVTLIMSGITTYINQVNIYKAQKEENTLAVGAYLEEVLQADGDDFAIYQDYFLKHYEEIDVPMDLSDCEEARAEYEELFAKEYPGEVLGSTIEFDELSPEVQKAYATYKHEYYLLAFEHASATFGLIYSEYLVPAEGDHMMTYMIDALREPKDEKSEYINLGVTVEQVLPNHAKMWEAWDTGEPAKGYDVYDNEYGKTYAYYRPCYINGVKYGVIGTEVEIANVNHDILVNTLRQILSIALVLIVCVLLVLLFINQVYITRIKSFSESVRQYSNEKDYSVAGDIEKVASGRDELSALGNQTAAMILELDNYMKSLVATTKELSDTKHQVDVVQELANKDSLTGIRNKTAYDKEIRRLEWNLEDGKTEFGIAMVDLNFLKRINDTYGHEQGNEAIKKCCRLICEVFAHSPVFRIGGDEFAIILEHHDYEHIEELVEKFNDELYKIGNDESLEVWERISAAIGYALYDKVKDDSVSNVFKRADKAMYARKTEMKAVRV
ncbi:MAG: GGDEF domain-containing protein [Lachnospiraceae bacterium]|nr:GGDEF domain-containing protein [Lachnospiraceae bacterium]MBR1524762.1 GGDEF domain-containing protein [Lachnospiraceae bacterium]